MGYFRREKQGVHIKKKKKKLRRHMNPSWQTGPKKTPSFV